MHLSIAQLKLIKKKAFCQWNWGCLTHLWRVLVHSHHGQYLYKNIVTNLATKIMHWHRCSVHHNHLYFPIVQLFFKNNVCCFNNYIMCLLCAADESAYWLLPLDKNERNTEWCGFDAGTDTNAAYVVALKWSNTIPSMDTNIFPPYYSEWSWCAKLVTTLLL